MEEDPDAPRSPREPPVPGAAVAASLHPEGERKRAPHLDSEPGGQDRAKGHGHAAQRDLRAGFSAMLLRLPSGPPSARRARGDSRHGVSRPIAYVLEADIQSYFDAIVRSELMALVERRIGDGSLL